MGTTIGCVCADEEQCLLYLCMDAAENDCLWRQIVRSACKRLVGRSIQYGNAPERLCDIRVTGKGLLYGIMKTVKQTLEEKKIRYDMRVSGRTTGRESASKPYDYLIVGAGLFGMVFAREATDAGKRCLVVEKRGHIGGNIYTETMAGITVHTYGAHIFHTKNEAVWRYVNRFARFNRFTNAPVANYKGELYNLPFNMNTFHAMWGTCSPAEAKEKIAQQRNRAGIGEPKNLEEQAISLVGTDIFEKLVKGYTEKQWGRACKELPAFIIQRLPIRFTYDNSYFSDPYQGIPIDGYTALAERLLDGIEVRLQTDYLAEKRKYDALAGRVVYTGPIDAYFGYAAGALEYRSVRFETEILDTDNYQGVAVMNYTDRETPYTRIIEHKHFAFGTQERTVVSREYPSEWKRGDEPFYPINDEKNQSRYAQYRILANREEHVLFGGRLGSYCYYDMDRVIESALEAARKELD